MQPSKLGIWEKLLFGLLIAAGFALLGCIATPVQHNKNVDLTLGPLQTVCADLNGTPCSCMVCKNNSGIFGTYSLRGGSCAFTPCNQTSFGLLNQSKGSFPGFFLIGQGPSTSDFNFANTYCNNSLTMAVNWLIGKNGNAPVVPQPSTSGCFLDHKAIPVYLYYTAKQNMDPTVAGNIGTALKNIGPVIVSAEINMSVADMPAVKAQIAAIKAKCTNCLIAITPADLDNETLNTVFSENDPAFNWTNNTDIIGQGIFLNENVSTCDIRTEVGRRIQFAQGIAQKYGKPVLWEYFAAKPGPTSLAGCTWTSQDVALAYNYTLLNSWFLSASGVMGVAQYGYNTTALPGTSGYLLANAANLKHPEANGWFLPCQINAQNFTQSPIVLPQANGSFRSCSFGINLYMSQFTSFNSDNPVIDTGSISSSNVNKYVCS